MECLDDNAATEFVAGSLSGAGLDRAERHLASCRGCRTLVAALAADGGDDSDLDTAPRPVETVQTGGGRGVPPRRLAIGDRVGRYLVLGTLGAGGMGVVFTAYDPHLDRKVALKLLRPGAGAATDEARARLKREAQAIAQLSHPNVVAVYDVGTTAEGADGDVYVAMEFVEGDNLTAWLRRYPRSPREILELFLQAGRGLSAAHAVGLLHRDFKPDNVLVGGDGRVRVGDFGLARSLLVPDDAARPDGEVSGLDVALTATGAVLGTPRYMPPEQLQGPNIDARADQFSFCVALYEALYGEHPLEGATAVAMLDRGIAAKAPPEGGKIDPAIGRAVARGLDRDRARRHPSMQALLAELTPTVRRSPARWIAAGAFGLLVAGVATAAVLRRGELPVGPRDPEIAVLVAKVAELEADRKHLMDKLKRAEADHAKLGELAVELEHKDDQIHQLVAKITTLQAAQPSSAPVAPVRPRPAPPQTVAIPALVELAEGDVAGCMREWSERHPGEAARLLVSLEVSPEGVGHSASAVGVDDSVLGTCVADALARVHYPRGPEQVELEVAVAFEGGGLALTPRIAGHRAAGSTIIDTP